MAKRRQKKEGKISDIVSFKVKRPHGVEVGEPSDTVYFRPTAPPRQPSPAYGTGGRICSRCGIQVPHDTYFCPECGYHFPRGVAAPVLVPREAKKTPLWIKILAALGLLWVLGVVLLLLSGGW